MAEARAGRMDHGWTLELEDRPTSGGAARGGDGHTHTTPTPTARMSHHEQRIFSFLWTNRTSSQEQMVQLAEAAPAAATNNSNDRYCSNSNGNK